MNNDWNEVIEKGKTIYEKSLNKRLPGELLLIDFMHETGYGKEKAKKILMGLIEAGLVIARKEGRITYYSPKH